MNVRPLGLSARISAFRPRAGLALAAGVMVVAASAGAAPAASRARAQWPSVRHAQVLARIDSAFAHDRVRGQACADSFVADARRRDDRGLAMVLALHRASSRAFFLSAFDDARDTCRAWLPFARAVRDTASECVALRTLAYVDLSRANWAAADSSYSRMLTLARRARLGRMEAYALIGASYLDIQFGRFARAERGYRAALRQLAHDADDIAERTARAGLGHALMQEHRPEEARVQYRRVLAESRAAGDRFNEFDALNDLGSLEYAFGDPSQAAPWFRAAALGYHSVGREYKVLTSLRNVALTMLAFGDDDGAAALLDSVVVRARAQGSPEMQAYALTGFSNARRQGKRYKEATSTARAALALRDSISTLAWLEAVRSLSLALMADGRAAEAARVTRDALEDPARRLSAGSRGVVLGLLGWAQAAAGDPARAIDAFREALASAPAGGGELGTAHFMLEGGLAQAYLASGRADSALAHYRRAAERWERTRAQPANPAWRDAISGQSTSVYGRYAAILLDPARGGTARTRAESVFAALQPFRARTLEDAVRGGQGRESLPRVTLEDLQRHVLRAGEIFVDVFPARDTTIVVAVTRDDVLAYGAPAGTTIEDRASRLRALASDPASDPALIQSVAKSLGESLLGPAARMLAGAHTVLLSCGGLAVEPLSLLRVPGEGGPVGASRVVAFVPSATLLALGRRGADDARRGGLLALCRDVGPRGVRLEGVSREARGLGRDVPGASVRLNDGRRTLEDMLHDLQHREVLHIASHARSVPAAPWRAGFLLGRGDGDDAYLTADRIATLSAPARLCVLAGCNSTGISFRGESLPLLAAAWLSAGARAVVATQWAQSDPLTADFVATFYRALRSGRSVGEALGDARRDVSRSPGVGATAEGFVVIGDPTLKVRLGPGARL